MIWLCLAGILSAGSAWGNPTGKWSCNDGGSCYLRQTGSTIVWYGESSADRPAWANVFSGRIHRDRIDGRWVNVPKGCSGGSGSLELAVVKNGTELRVIKKSGGLVDTRWTRSAVDTIGDPANPSEAVPVDKACIRFDPAAVALGRVDGSWKIVDSGRWLFDLGKDEVVARQAIRRHGFSHTCVVGRPDPGFTYLRR
jgi:hypothetical protein